MHALLVFTGVLGKLLSMAEIQLDVLDITNPNVKVEDIIRCCGGME